MVSNFRGLDFRGFGFMVQLATVSGLVSLQLGHVHGRVV